jgi:signal transduction histidine kinase
MFKNLRTSTKLILLCAMFIISLAVTTYSLVAEKQIAITFARKELIGSKFLAALRNIDVALLKDKPFDPPAAESDSSEQAMLQALAAGQAAAGPALQTEELARALSNALRRLGAVSSTDSAATDVLTKVQQLAVRIGDDSNLTLDTDIDAYYAQNIVVDQMPKLLGFVGELQLATREDVDAAATSNESKAHLLVLYGLIGSSAGEIKDDLTAAYRGNADGRLKQSVDSTYASLFSAIDAYLAGSKPGVVNAGGARLDDDALRRLFEAVVNSANNAWAKSQFELDRLLRSRIDKLQTRMRLSLALIGALVGLSIILAIMTYRHIVQPLEQLEKVASTVRKTKDFDLRVADNNTNEIGKLSSAFDEMLAELASARDRERAEQSELARVARVATMGVMTASIAHEISQPLTAIVSNGQAAQRWLSHVIPDLDEARAALKKVVDEGRRAGQIIDGLRAMFRKEGSEKDQIDVNGLVVSVLTLIKSEIRKKGISVRTELLPNLPYVLAGRTQLQQVLMNLIMNAIEAMDAITEREKLLVIKSAIDESASILITVKDTGKGIDPQNIDRIFDAFFTTKSTGMGMGLSICRSIIESYGGRLWASPVEPYGSVFYVVLPSAESSKPSRCASAAAAV